MRTLITSSLAVSASLSIPFALTDTAVAQTAGADTLGRVVVTATRTEESVRRIGDSVTVLEAEEVRRSQKTAVSDLLAATPGVAVSRNGGLGTTTAVRIRGAESDHTVVLIDGVKLNDPSAPGGGYNFGNLIASDFARIEVLRGPQSTLWGSQALGGVVNIVTSPPGGPLSATISAEGGARGTAALSARAEAGGERFAWRVGGNYLTTDGVSAFDGDLGGAEKDGYRNVGLHARGLLHITDTASAEIRSTWSKGRTELDGFPPPAYAFADTDEYGYCEELVTYAGVNLAAFGGRLQNRIGFAYTGTDSENFDPGSVVPMTFDAVGRNERWEYQGVLAITDAVSAVFGLESERSELETVSPSMFDPNPQPLTGDVRLDSAYAQVQLSPLPSLTLLAGLRRDDHETFGGSTTGRASIAWSVMPATILRTSYGQGFKAPTLYQLFSEYGNIALEPEEADGWDAGIEQHFFDEALVVSATYFDRDTTNRIDFVSCFGSADPRCAAQPFGFYDNVQKTDANGVELALRARLAEPLSLAASYTNMDSRNAARGSANYGRTLARRPRETASAQIAYSWPMGLATALAVQYVGRNFEDAANTLVLDSYTLVDLRAAYAVSKRLEVYGRLENAFDENYATALRYGSVGRGGFVGFRQSF